MGDKTHVQFRGTKASILAIARIVADDPELPSVEDSGADNIDDDLRGFNVYDTCPSIMNQIPPGIGFYGHHEGHYTFAAQVVAQHPDYLYATTIECDSILDADVPYVEFTRDKIPGDSSQAEMYWEARKLVEADIEAERQAEARDAKQLDECKADEAAAGGA